MSPLTTLPSAVPNVLVLGRFVEPYIRDVNQKKQHSPYIYSLSIGLPHIGSPCLENDCCKKVNNGRLLAKSAACFGLKTVRNARKMCIICA